MKDPEINLTFDEQKLPADPPYTPDENQIPLRQLMSILPLMVHTLSGPTGKPKSFADQFRLYYSGSHLNLCVYDPTFAVWFYLDLSGVPFI